MKVVLKIGERRLDIGEASAFSEALEHALRGLARSVSKTPTPEITYEIARARVGSLHLAIQPTSRVFGPQYLGDLCKQFTSDIRDVGKASQRPDMEPDVYRNYLRMIRCLGKLDATVELSYGRQRVVIDPQFRESVEVHRKERVSQDITIRGTVEGVDTHGKYFSFYLYPKLEAQGRVECIFVADQLPVVADMLKHRRLVSVTGTGYFGPVGLYPHRIEVSQVRQVPETSIHKAQALKRSSNIVPKGMTIQEYIQQNREAAGFGD